MQKNIFNTFLISVSQCIKNCEEKKNYFFNLLIEIYEENNENEENNEDEEEDDNDDIFGTKKIFISIILFKEKTKLIY